MQGQSRFGIARMYGIVFGITYIAVALIEDILGSSGLSIGGTLVLKVTPQQNAIHWAVGLVVLISALIGELAATWVARIVGVVFVAITVWGFVARDSLGSLLGFKGPLPWSYNIVHLVTAAAALFAGFAASRVYGENEQQTGLRRAA